MTVSILKNWQVHHVDRSVDAVGEWLRRNPGPAVKPSKFENTPNLVWLATPAADASRRGHPKYSAKRGRDLATTDGAFFDVDGAACAPAATQATADALRAHGLGFIWSASHSADAEHLRGHLQLVYAEPCPAEHHAHVWLALRAALCPGVDGRQYSPVRGRNAPAPGVDVVVSPGALVDWREWLAKAPAPPEYTDAPTPEVSATQDSSRDAEVVTHLATVWGRGCSGDRAFGGLGGWLLKIGVSVERARWIGTAVANATQSTHPDVESRVEQAYEGEHLMGFTSLVDALTTDTTGIATAQADMGGAALSVREALARAEAVLRASVTAPAPAAVAPADVPAPTQDLSGLHTAPSGWPWVLRKGPWCWLHTLDDKTYGNAIEKTDLKLQIRRTHSRAVLLTGAKGADIPEHEFEQRYQARVADLKASYLARSHTWDPGKQTLTLAVLRWAGLAATFDADVDVWLRALGGRRYDRLAQWLASCAALDRPAPALYIHGEMQTGKSLLARGLARLWQTEPAPFAEALDSFNEAAASCPLMYADEGFPDGMSFNTFREMVTSQSRRVNEKYKPKYAVEGCVRIILSTNNEQALRYQKTGVLTAQDMQAISDRLLVIHAGAAARDALKRFDAPTFVDNNRIAAHVLWLAETVELEPRYERMCAKPEGAGDVLESLQTARYAQILRAIAPAFREPTEKVDGVYFVDGSTLINIRKLLKVCSTAAFMAHEPAPREQDIKDFVNAFRVGPVTRLRDEPGAAESKPSERPRVHPVDTVRIKAQVIDID